MASSTSCNYSTTTKGLQFDWHMGPVIGPYACIDSPTQHTGKVVLVISGRNVDIHKIVWNSDISGPSAVHGQWMAWEVAGVDYIRMNFDCRGNAIKAAAQTTLLMRHTG